MGTSLVYLPLNLIILNLKIVTLYISKTETTRIDTSVRYPLIIIIITRNTKFYNYYSNSTVHNRYSAATIIFITQYYEYII